MRDVTICNTEIIGIALLKVMWCFKNITASQNIDAATTRQTHKKLTICVPATDDEKAFLFKNIVGAECIVCTHWLNIAGAAAPIAPLVLTPMRVIKINITT